MAVARPIDSIELSQRHMIDQEAHTEPSGTRSASTATLPIGNVLAIARKASAEIRILTTPPHSSGPGESLSHMAALCAHSTQFRCSLHAYAPPSTGQAKVDR
jgi:hypothetical protein